MNKSITLNAGAETELIYETGVSEFVLVRQIPIKDYPAGFRLADDEIALVGFLCAGRTDAPSVGGTAPVPSFRPKAWAETLTPDSYEKVLASGKEFNANGFFAYCGRQQAAAQSKLESQLRAMATLPPEAVKAAMETGLAKQARSPLPISSPAFP